MNDDDRTIIARRVSRVPPGTRLNGIYQVDSLLDFGGMSEIYRGHNIQTLDEVAIKVILPEFASDERMVSLFRREALILNRLSHEAIIRYHVFSHDPAADLLYLAMEYVNGPTLRSRIKQRPLSQIEACRLIAKVAAGMRAAHAEGVVHRDLSTDNIILLNGDVTRPKVIDFGIARAGDGNDSTLLQSGFAGKYNFVSPEQLGLHDGQIGQTSDIYSLGLVFAAALLGKPLDMAGSHAEVVMKRQSVPDLSLINPGVKPLIERMLQPNPAHRPQSMDDVVMALELFLGQRREATQPGTGPKPVLPRVKAAIAPPRRRGMGLLTALLLFAAFAVGGWWGLTRTAQGRVLLSRISTLLSDDTVVGQSRPPDVTGAAVGKSEIKAAPDGTIVRPPDDTVQKGDLATEPAPGAQKVAKADGGKPVENESAARPVETAEAVPAADIPVPPAEAEATQGPQAGGEEASSHESVTPAEPDVPVAAEPGNSPEAPHVGAGAEPQEAEVAMVDPQRPATEEDPQEAPAIGPAEWVTRFQGGDCYYARATRIAANDVAIEGFGTSSAPFEDMDKRFASAFGFEASIGVRAISAAQCSIVDFVRESEQGGDAMRVAMTTDLIGANEPVEARVSGISQRHVALFAVSPDGEVAVVTDYARRDGNDLSVNIVPGEKVTARAGGYLLWTVASSKPLAALDMAGTRTATEIVAELQAAASAQGASLQQSIKYFRKK